MEYVSCGSAIRSSTARKSGWSNHKIDSESYWCRFSAPTVTLADGERIGGVLVVAADGICSPTRSLFLGKDTQPQLTGHMAYGMVINADKVEDNKLQTYMAQLRINTWFGPDAHAVAYTLRGEELFKIVLLVKDDLPE
ncbi:hypothetical protein MMC29_004332, partial [Sticta canariensis]|nr:hypothetical protein [Sticta canariensis]